MYKQIQLFVSFKLWNSYYSLDYILFIILPDGFESRNMITEEVKKELTTTTPACKCFLTACILPKRHRLSPKKYKKT